MRIEIDADGYPTEASITGLREWTLKGEVSEIDDVLEAVAEYLNECSYGRAWVEAGEWHFVTGGWSGCEEVIGAIPALVQAVAWQSSHRGGLHIYTAGGK